MTDQKPHIDPPFRADHVGSLLRPQRLADARAQAKRGELTAEGLAAIENECIRDVVAFQESVGLQSITDGEYRRDYWHLDFLTGFDGIELWTAERGKGFNADEQPPTTRVTGKVGRSAGIFTDHFAYLKSVTSRTPKITIPGPGMLHLRPGREGVDPKAYGSMSDFWDDVCAAYRSEIAELGSLGCNYLQIDDVSFAYLCDEKTREGLAARGDDPDETLDLYVDLINRVVSEKPAGMTVTVHMCRGNFKSRWVAEGGYERIAEGLFPKMQVDGFFLEYDNERAGGFEPLRFVPDDKVVVLGLITSKSPELEKEDDVRRRIDEAAQFVPAERLCLSPQCGFSSTHHGNALTEDDEKRKLDLVVRIADSVWG